MNALKPAIARWAAWSVTFQRRSTLKTVLCASASRIALGAAFR